jgi:hypothetical protein
MDMSLGQHKDIAEVQRAHARAAASQGVRQIQQAPEATTAATAASSGLQVAIARQSAAPSSSSPFQVAIPRQSRNPSNPLNPFLALNETEKYQIARQLYLAMQQVPQAEPLTIHYTTKPESLPIVPSKRTSGQRDVDSPKSKAKLSPPEQNELQSHVAQLKALPSGAASSSSGAEEARRGPGRPRSMSNAATEKRYFKELNEEL